MRRLFVKLETQLSTEASLSVLFIACLYCSLKGVAQAVVGNRQYLGNFSHGIAFISQNKNRLSFRKQSSFYGHFKSTIKSTHADAPDTQLA